MKQSRFRKNNQLRSKTYMKNFISTYIILIFFSIRYLDTEACYRFASVGHDTQLCLWELPEEAMAPTRPRVKRRPDPLQLVGTPTCPRLDECPILEPLICKKIAHERLTALVFRPDCIITACQEGYVYTWARPLT